MFVQGARTCDQLWRPAHNKLLAARTFRRPDYFSTGARTAGGVSGLASMLLVVFSDKRPSLCFAFMIVQAVLRCTPRAFACASKEV